MKKKLLFILLLLLSSSLTACDSGSQSLSCRHSSEDKQEKRDLYPNGKESNSIRSSQGKGADMTDLVITIGNKHFDAKLEVNASTEAWLRQLPATFQMKDLNGNEKYYCLANPLPTSPQQVKAIRTGDLMLYGPNCLVLFYKNGETDYPYTRLGYIADPSGLSEALDEDSVEIRFKVTKK